MSVEKNILVIQTAFPGDALLTLPFIQELKKKNPGYLIDVLCIPLTAEIFSASPYIQKVIAFDKKGGHKSLKNFFRFLNTLKKNGYEIVYSPHRSLRSGILAMSMSAQKSYGFENSVMKFAFSKVVKYDYTAHEVKRNLEFLETEYHENQWKIIPDLVIPEESIIKVKNFFSEYAINKFISVAPGSVWETKKYPVDYYKRIIKHFSDLEYTIVLIGGNSDKELCESIKKDFDKNVINSAGYFSFIETIQLLKHTSLLICNDSAPTHLGVCADIPVLTIYCSTTPNFGFYPYNAKSDFISFDKIYCKPCGIHGHEICPTGTFDCARLLSPEIVIKRAEKLLSDENR